MECGYEPVPAYIVERLPSIGWEPVPGTDGCNLLLTLEDLPELARVFNLEYEVVDGRIIWSCRICGELGSRLVCNPDKHDAYYAELGEQGGVDALEPLDERGRRDRRRGRAAVHG